LQTEVLSTGAGGGQPANPVQGQDGEADTDPVENETTQDPVPEQRAANNGFNLAQEVRNLLQGMQTVFQAVGGPSRVDGGQNNQQKAVTDILKGKLRPLNPRATDMAQELDAFFEHINEYLQAAKLTDLASTTQHTQRVSILNGTLGEEAKRALKSIRDTDKTTYERYRAAIRRFLTEYDLVHVMVMLVQCTMTADESTKEYVTRLWAHVARLEDLSEVWHERLILVMLRLGHSKAGGT
jgi:hypothetical protein